MSRRKIGLLRSKKVGSSKYFSEFESKETVSERLYTNVRELRGPYKFKSGAIYKGEWKGGLRDGFGTQQWPDGAKYVG